MDIGLVVTLVALALVDSTSFGTLLIPLWLLLAPGPVRVARILTFLATVAGFYLLLGLALVAGLTAVTDALADLLDGAVVARAQLVVGGAMLVGSFFIPGTRNGPGRMDRWRDRALSGRGARGLAGLMGLALTAAALEAATMLPYLAASGLVAAAELPRVATTAVLAGYCLVMVLPALLLMAVRLGARHAVEPTLGRLAAWLQRQSGDTLAWVVGIVGFLVARDALVRLPEVTRWLETL